MELNSDQVDALTELMNISVGRAAASLSELVGARVGLHVPRVDVLRIDSALATHECLTAHTLASVRQSFNGGLSGQGALLFPKDSAVALGALLTDQPCFGGGDIDGECEGVLTEVGNILLNAVLGSMARLVGTQVVYDLPVFAQASPKRVFEEFTASIRDHEDARVLLVETSFDVCGKNISGRIMVFCKLESLERLKAALAVPHL